MTILLHLLKKKCDECGTLHPVDHATECTGCGEPNESLVTACEKHSTLKLASASSCPVCDVEQEVEKFDRKERDWVGERDGLKEEITQKDREITRLKGVESTLNTEVASLRGRPKENPLVRFLDWLEGPSVDQSDWKSLLAGSLLASLLTFFCLNNFTLFDGLDGDWIFHISGWFTALTAGILTSQLLWRLNLSFVSIRGGKLVISFFCGTVMIIILNASWGMLLSDITPSVFFNAIVVLPIFWWTVTMNSVFGERKRHYGWGKYFYYGAPYFPWREIIGRSVATGLSIQSLNRTKTLVCIGISAGMFIFALWLLIWGLPGMVDTAKQRETDGFGFEEIRQRIIGINPRYPIDEMMQKEFESVNHASELLDPAVGTVEFEEE
jgi:hypothetical protein